MNNDKGDDEFIAIHYERNTMHLLLSPVLAASGIYIGGGAVGVLLVIIIVVILLRR